MPEDSIAFGGCAYRGQMQSANRRVAFDTQVQLWVFRRSIDL